MEREQFLEQVGMLRAGGKSIRAIARELDVHRSSVERALKNLRRAQADEQSSSLDHARPQDRAGKENFVGRHQEVGDLKAALEGALSGHGQLVMLAGEPGIGKTRTAQELTTYASQIGVQVLWGRCYEEQGMPPYWPWVQIIRSYVRGRGPGGSRLEMGAGAAEIAELVPEVRERLPDLPTPPSLEPQQARFRLFDSIATFLMQTSQTQPLMLVLENIHWADRSSLLLLEFLAQESADCRLLVVGTYRDTEPIGQHPLNHTLGELSRHPHFSRVLLRGLSEDEVGRFIQADAGFVPPQNLISTVYAQTEGNPLFLTQVVQLLAQEGELTPERATEGREWKFQMPAGVREVIGRRLERLSETCNRSLVVASVVGREFGLDLLERLMADAATALSSGSGGRLAHGLSGDEVLEAIEEALAARVIEEMPEPGNRYQFTHVLIQNTLAQRMSAARRARVHWHIADTLEALYGSSAETHASELAHHYAETSAILGTEKLVHYSLLAGEQALAAYAWEDALGHFQRGLTAKGVVLTGADLAKDAEEAALLSGLGRAQVAVLERYQFGQAVDNLIRSLDYYAAEGDVEQVVAVAETPVTVISGYQTGAALLLDRALTVVPPGSHTAGRLLSMYGRIKGIEEGDYMGAQDCFNQALDIAAREGDQVLAMQTLANSVQVDLLHVRFKESLEQGLAVVNMAQNLDKPRSEVIARYYLAPALAMTGDLEGARMHAAAMLSAAERLRDRTWLSNAICTNETLARSSGDWQAAREFCAWGRAISAGSDIRFDINVALVQHEVGDFEQGGTHLRRAMGSIRVDLPQLSSPYAYFSTVLALIARINGRTELLDTAEMMATGIISSPLALPIVARTARGTLGLVAVQRGDITMAEDQYTGLHSGRGSLLAPRPLISVDRLLGLLARTMGLHDQATSHFEDGLIFCRKAGYRPELAWVCYDYADTLLQGNGQSGNDYAVALLEESLSISRELNMRPLMERVVAHKQWAESQPAKAPAYPDGLTEREVEVLRFIVLGKSNQEIAATLLISPNTVVHHVTSILSKTGASNRAEAAAYAVRQSLAP